MENNKELNVDIDLYKSLIEETFVTVYENNEMLHKITKKRKSNIVIDILAVIGAFEVERILYKTYKSMKNNKKEDKYWTYTNNDGSEIKVPKE